MNTQHHSLLAAHAVMDVSVNGGPRVFFHNLVPLEGRNAILDIVFGGQSKPAGLYFAPFAGNVSPANSWTGNAFNANATEFMNYTEATRQAVVVSPADAGAMNNYAARAEITIGAGTNANDLVLRGLGVVTSSVKQATTNTLLLSAARLPSDRTGLVEGDVIALGFSISLSNPS